jgi:glycosyltransferase involved in cell wall biosynthesis
MNQPLRVAFVITELEVGGAERCLTEVACGLDRGRFEPTVICLAPRPENPLLVERLSAYEIPIHFLGARSIAEFIRVRAELRRRLESWQPHVVQTFLFHANVLAASVLKRAPVPRLVMGIRVADPSRWRAYLERWAARRAERVVCVSKAVGDFVTLRGGILPKKITVIGNGVDIREFTDATPADLRPLGIPNDRKMLTCIARLHPQKGIDLLIRQLPKALASLPEHDLLLVGEGPQRAELKRLAVELGIASRVHFVGHRHDIPQILARSELLVLLSRWEGMPNVVLEAMASERPVLVRDVEGVAELLGPLAEQQMLSTQAIERFADRLVEILSDDELARLLGQRNRARVASCFETTSMVRQYAHLYEAIASG